MTFGEDAGPRLEGQALFQKGCRFEIESYFDSIGRAWRTLKSSCSSAASGAARCTVRCLQPQASSTSHRAHTISSPIPTVHSRLGTHAHTNISTCRREERGGEGC